MKTAEEIAAIFITGVQQGNNFYWGTREICAEAIRAAQIDALEWALTRIPEHIVDAVAIKSKIKELRGDK